MADDTASLKPPARHLPDAARPFTFHDPSKASAAGKRSGQVRRLQATIVQQIKASLPPLPPNYPFPVQLAEDAVQLAINGQLALVKDQIARTIDVLNDNRVDYCPECERGGMQPHHRAQLLKALDALLDRQRKLLGIPDPGNRRPAPERHTAPARPEPVFVPATRPPPPAP